MSSGGRAVRSVSEEVHSISERLWWIKVQSWLLAALLVVTMVLIAVVLNRQRPLQERVKHLEQQLATLLSGTTAPPLAR